MGAEGKILPKFLKGRSPKKITGKCGNFSQVGGPPPPSPLFGNDMFVKKKYGLFCISGP